MKDQTKAKVRIRLRGDCAENKWLWADPVTVDDDGDGVYCLYNTAFWAPFTLGDLVEVRRDRHGDLQVVGLHRRGGRTGYLVVFPQDAGWSRTVFPLAEGWRSTGAYSEGGYGGTVLAVSVPGDAGARPTVAELEDLVSRRVVESFVVPALPDDSPGDAALFAEVDLRPDAA